MNTYESFMELASNEAKGKDYSIEYEKRNPDVAVLAIHGGNIEKGTSELAYEVAKQLNATFYTLKGLKKGNNRKLHITSAKFDEPIALELVKSSLYTVSVHGARGEEPLTYMGGRDASLKNETAEMLASSGFFIKDAPDEINGDHPNNIANRNKRGMGLQLELTQAQRYLFFENEVYGNSVFRKYAYAIEQAVRFVMSIRTK
ncbi:poly-gamma-glutamate hydrolase family protein [Ectobacillus panaciterrae]|uniref:poly-gamma-glutamate hydrolase family protein n=1 Tax=Ectobacillus panaciterrae TaxID=363872 RepID=UPI00041C5DA1|nr:poly-gamma-glutamate hydrolase family protein [Ectobacillus panaciterrae]